MPLFIILIFLAFVASPARAEEVTAARVLAEINLARTQPQTYARIVAEALPRQRTAAARSAAAEAVRHLEKMRALPPLAPSSGLIAAAASHVADAGPRGMRGHRGSGFSSPWSRIDRYGRRFGTAGENICYGATDPRAIVVMQLIDAGVPSRGHRKHILSPSFTLAGVAVGPHATYGTMCVLDFAAAFVEHMPKARTLAAR